MSTNPTKLTPSGLAALMCARICHDILNPVASLNTAFEVLDDESSADMHDDAMQLLRTSTQQTTAKLEYLRLAFGAGGSTPELVGMEELKRMVDGVYRDGKATISWDNRIQGLPKNQARLLLNLIMITVQTIPFGGKLLIRTEEKGGANILTLIAEGRKARLEAGVLKTLAGKAPEDGFDGRMIQPFYTGMIAREIKGRIDPKIDGETVTFIAFLPGKAAQNAA